MKGKTMSTDTSITWNTGVDAPCCPGEIVCNATGQTILIQSDWDYPGVATTFGWYIGEVRGPIEDCDHDGTDGTVDCPNCHLPASDFIVAAGEYLAENDGATAEDPGYFDDDE